MSGGFILREQPSFGATWWPSVPDSTWVQIAGGVGFGATYQNGALLNDIITSPGSSNPPGSWGHADAVFDAFTGGSVDQTRNEFIIAAGGGHSDGANNACYALALNVPIPYWRRLVDCTPDANLGDVTVENGGKFDDGRPRAMHASNMCWAGGRVWFPMMSSVTSGQGGHADLVLSFDRDTLGAALTPLAWTGSNIGPWTFWGSSNQSTSVFGFGLCVFDTVNNQLIAVNNGSASAGAFWQKIPVTGGSTGVSSAFNAGSPNVFPSWGACCPDLGIVVVGEGLGQRIAVLDIGANTWSIPSVGSGGYYNPTNGFSNTGSVYCQVNHTILVADPHQTGDTIYRLAIPMSGSAYNSGGTFTWTTLSPTGGPTNGYVNAGSNYVASKWNIIKDMGDGRSALICPTDITKGTYIYKIPAAGP